MALPFKLGKIIEDPYFVNREEEIEYITQILLSKLNLTLISPRRWGKSSLIRKVARDVDKKHKNIIFCFIDLFNTRTEEEFYEYFATEVIKSSYSKWDERVDKVKEFFKQIIPKFSLGIDPNQQFSVSFDWESVKRHPDEILNLPERISQEKNMQIVVCLDEFQNIAHYGDSLGFQKKLRSAWQNHQHCSYVLYGSKRHMMTELFENKSMPFYKFGEILFLSKIANEHWVLYIQKQFRKSGKKISRKLARQLADRVENHPYFVQQLANSVWLATEEVCEKDELETGMNNLLEQYSMFLSRELDSVSNLQLNLLKAIAMDEDQLTGKDTVKKYRLSSSSSVIRSKEALIQKEIIDTFNNKTQFLDPLLKIWIRTVYLNKEL